MDVILTSCSISETLFLTILPAIVAGMLNSQACRIRVTLNNKLLLEKGKNKLGKVRTI